MDMSSAADKLNQQMSAGRNRMKQASSGSVPAVSAVSKALVNIIEWMDLPPVETDADVRDRQKAYLIRCTETGQRPTVEGLAVALGITTPRLQAWRSGKDCSPERMQMINAAVQVIAALDAELVASGVMTPTAYSFRAKNLYGMKDQVSYEIQPLDPVVTKSPEALEEYLNVIDGNLAAPVTDDAKPKKKK
jgi:hypothetical protein